MNNRGRICAYDSLKSPGRNICPLAIVLALCIGALFSSNRARAIEIVDASQPADFPQPRFSRPAGTIRIGGVLRQADSYFQTDAGKRIIANIISWQNADGGWWKNQAYDNPRPATVPDDPASGPPGDDDAVWHRVSTFDNDCTYSEMKVLAHAYRVTREPADLDAFNRALEYCFASQYPDGGWPQRFPIQDNYGARITFNDDAMIHVMEIMKDVSEKKPDFAFCTDGQRARARTTFERGVDCILKCQYMQNGKLTVWGQQHDEHTFALAGGRTFELAGLTACESADILELLEGVDHPDQRVRDSIEAAHAWYENSKIVGKRLGRDSVGRVLVEDRNAPPLWARFYDPQTNRPFVAGRDGIARARLEEITAERRNGYSWFSSEWGVREANGYRAWKARMESAAPAAQPG
jgi:PelA/Pel-15E family pectate lyase